MHLISLAFCRAYFFNRIFSLIQCFSFECFFDQPLEKSHRKQCSSTFSFSRLSSSHYLSAQVKVRDLQLPRIYIYLSFPAVLVCCSSTNLSRHLQTTLPSVFTEIVTTPALTIRIICHIYTARVCQCW